MKFYIHVTPTNTNFPPHEWTEGGTFVDREKANYYAKQLRAVRSPYNVREKFYSKVEVRP